MKLGIDEAGRGALAGPLSVCIFHSKNYHNKLRRLFYKQGKYFLRDSKKLSEKERVRIFIELEKLKKQNLIDYVHIFIDNHFIDQNGIRLSLQLGIKKCLEELILKYGLIDRKYIFLDGALDKKFGKVLIKGDERILEIALASIVAKVLRDKYMHETHKNSKYKKYNFEENKGYGTKAHIKKIFEIGISDLHRKSFCTNFIAKN